MWRAKQTIAYALRNVESYALADPKVDTVAEAKAETLVMSRSRHCSIHWLTV